MTESELNGCAPFGTFLHHDTESYPMKMDESNIAIIRHLRDGRKSRREIATALGVSENTVRGRVKRLTEEGVLTITGLVDAEALPGHRVAIIGVKLGTMDLISKGEEFSKIRGVVSVCVVTGRFDLMLVALFNDEFRLLDFYADEVSKIKNVQSVETFIVYKGYNLMVPYLL
jgi:Lrp/AsnC family transcriptional regulator for asnA, asnC and gidA